MKFTETKIKGSYLIDLEYKKDNRGFFARLFCTEEFSRMKLNTKWMQINNSLSEKKGTLRGPHIQIKPYQEAKLVKCINGKVWDVVIDLRRNSSTFGQWFGVTLDHREDSMIYIPEGCGHGMLSLTDQSEVIYLASESYTPTHELCLLWNDSFLDIKWPISPQILTEKEEAGLTFEEIKYLLEN